MTPQKKRPLQAGTPEAASPRINSVTRTLHRCQVYNGNEGEAMNEGLVAPSWSDSGDVPVGEVTYTIGNITWEYVDAYVMGDGRVSVGWRQVVKPADPDAKPSNPALCRVAGEAYRGLGWCDQGGDQ